jgi:hypothetical protein
MKRLRTWLLRLAGVMPNAKRESDFVAELDAHLQLHIDDNLRAGMNPEQARREALLKLGGVESTNRLTATGTPYRFSKIYRRTFVLPSGNCEKIWGSLVPPSLCWLWAFAPTWPSLLLWMPRSLSHCRTKIRSGWWPCLNFCTIDGSRR